jgi:hypothetical protein
MKKCTLIISLFVFACNSKEDQLKKQLSDLESELPKAEKEYYQSRNRVYSMEKAIGYVSGIEFEKATDNDDR